MDFIKYKKDMGKITLTEEMMSSLKGLTLEEQTKQFAIEKCETSENYLFGEEALPLESSIIMEVGLCKAAKSWIVKDGIIVGMVFIYYNGKDSYCFLDPFGYDWGFRNNYVNEQGPSYREINVKCRIVWRGKINT